MHPLHAVAHRWLARIQAKPRLKDSAEERAVARLRAANEALELVGIATQKIQSANALVLEACVLMEQYVSLLADCDGKRPAE